MRRQSRKTTLIVRLPSMWGRLLTRAAVGYPRRNSVQAAVAPVNNRRAAYQAAPQEPHLDGKVVAPIQAAHNRPVARGASSLLQTYQRSDRPLRISGLAIDCEGGFEGIVARFRASPKQRHWFGARHNRLNGWCKSRAGAPAAGSGILIGFGLGDRIRTGEVQLGNRAVN